MCLKSKDIILDVYVATLNLEPLITAYESAKLKGSANVVKNTRRFVKTSP